MPSIAELLHDYKSLDDKIAAIFYSMELTKIPINMEKLHVAFFDFSKAYPDFLSDIHFKIGGRFPYSESLDQTFPGLALSGYISCKNPEFRFYEIDQEQRKLIDQNIMSLFSDDEKKTIRLIADKLKSILR